MVRPYLLAGTAYNRAGSTRSDTEREALLASYSHRLAALLFPREPRSLPGQRLIKITLRALHALAAGVLVGGWVFAPTASTLPLWHGATAATGLAIVVLDLSQTAAFLLQVRGLVVLAKVGALAVVGFLEVPARPWVLGVVFVLSVGSSHATSRIRYFLVFGRGRLRGSQARG